MQYSVLLIMCGGGAGNGYMARLVMLITTDDSTNEFHGDRMDN